MTYHLRLTAARHALGLERPEELTRVADQLLDQGVYTPLAELVLARNPGWLNSGELFRRTLRQLGVEPLGEQAAAEFLVRHYLWRIAEKCVPPLNGLWLFMEEFYEPLLLRGESPGILAPRLSALVSEYRAHECELTMMEEGFVAAEEGNRRTDKRGTSIRKIVDAWMVQQCLPALDPSWLAWNDGTVAKLARTIRAERAFDLLPVLGDALEEAGCTGRDVLDHCRLHGDHSSNCWVIDWLLRAR
jgi:hypothetical protein